MNQSVQRTDLEGRLLQSTADASFWSQCTSVQSLEQKTKQTQQNRHPCRRMLVTPASCSRFPLLLSAPAICRRMLVTLAGGCLSPVAETAVVICPRRRMEQKSTTSHL